MANRQIHLFTRRLHHRSTSSTATTLSRSRRASSLHTQSTSSGSGCSGGLSGYGGSLDLLDPSTGGAFAGRHGRWARLARREDVSGGGDAVSDEPGVVALLADQDLQQQQQRWKKDLGGSALIEGPSMTTS